MRYLNWINLVIATLIVFVGVQIVLKHVEAYFTVLPSENRLMAAARKNPEKPVTKNNENFNIIVERNLFQVENGYPEPYGTNSNLAYELMGPPVDRAIELGLRDELPDDYRERVALLESLLKDAEDRANELMII